MSIIEDVQSTLEKLGLRFWLSRDRDAVLVDMPQGGGLPGHANYVLQADEENSLVIIGACLCQVPGTRKRAISELLLAENSRLVFVSFGLNEKGLATAEVHINLKSSTNPKADVEEALIRLMVAVEAVLPQLIKRLNGRSQRTVGDSSLGRPLL